MWWETLCAELPAVSPVRSEERRAARLWASIFVREEEPRDILCIKAPPTS